MSALKFVTIPKRKTNTSKTTHNSLSYQVFGQPLHSAPIVLVNHALTGNSNVAGPSGWWNQFIGPAMGINTNRFTVLAFNLPGNGYDGVYLEDYSSYSTTTMAQVLLQGLDALKIPFVYAVIGGSLGGCIAWQMGLLRPQMFKYVIPVAAHYCASDWLIGLCRVQHEILKHSSKPVHDARLHAMTFYRSPESFTEKFNRTKNQAKGIFNTESWLLHHGKKLEARFNLKSYVLFNWLLLNHDVACAGFGDIHQAIKRLDHKLWLVGVSSDRFFLNNDIQGTHQIAKKVGVNAQYVQINSTAGHDAFLIEHEQLAMLLEPVFNNTNLEQLTHEYIHNKTSSNQRARIDRP